MQRPTKAFLQQQLLRITPVSIEARKFSKKQIRAKWQETIQKSNFNELKALYNQVRNVVFDYHTPFKTTDIEINTRKGQYSSSSVTQNENINIIDPSISGEHEFTLEKKIKNIKKLQNNGWSIDEIAKSLGISNDEIISLIHSKE